MRDRDDRCAVARAHEISPIQLADADAPADWRTNGGVAELVARIIDLRFVVDDLGSVLIDQRVLLVDLLTGGKILEDERVVALHIQDRAVEQSLVLLPDGDLLLQLRLQRLGINDGQDIALLDVLPLLKSGSR